MTATLVGPPHYEFKPRPYSSHTLLLEEFGLRGEGRRVLDLGCAGGYVSEILAARGYDVTGVDLPGTPHSASIRFVAGDLDAGLPSVGGLFDFIICADVLEHLREPQRVLEDCRRSLAPGGALLLSLPNSGHAYFRWNVLMGRFPRHAKGLFDRTHLHFYMWEGWESLLGAAGFRIEARRVSGVPAGLALPRWADSGVVRWLEWFSFQLARAHKTLFAYQFIVRARPECDI